MTEVETIFGGVNLASVTVFVTLMSDRSRLEEALLARRYREQALNFDETLAFMIALGAVRRERRIIVRCPMLDEMFAALNSGIGHFYEGVIRIALQSSTDYGDEIRKVLRRTRLTDGIGWLRPADAGGDRYAVRNFLMDAKALRLDSRRDAYRFSDWMFDHIIQTQYSHGTTPSRLRDIQQQQAELGRAAEEAVLAYEKRIVGSYDATSVVHIALSNVGAGFDIASLRRDASTDERLFRMIEVKAVSLSDWRFTLTRNEIDVARENCGHYFLYLVPIKSGMPSVDDMEIVRDPIRLLVEDSGWEVAEGEWTVHKATADDETSSGR